MGRTFFKCFLFMPVVGIVLVVCTIILAVVSVVLWKRRARVVVQQPPANQGTTGHSSGVETGGSIGVQAVQ